MLAAPGSIVFGLGDVQYFHHHALIKRVGLADFCEGLKDCLFELSSFEGA